MRSTTIAAICLLLVISCACAFSQAVINGVVSAPKFDGAKDRVPITNILSIASLNGPGSQAVVYRSKWDVQSWEHVSQGSYHISGTPGTYTFAFTNPNFYMRPILLTNVNPANGDRYDMNVSPNFDYACFDSAIKDETPATDYYQPFIAKGRSITQVGIKPTWDVNGPEGERDLLVSVLKRGEGTPDKWEQVGPTRVIPFQTLNNVACDGIGARCHFWSVGWNSGEVPTRPGVTYAVHIRTASPNAKFQSFEHANTDGKYMDCFRVGADKKKAYQKRAIWMAVSSDSDGLLIPYNKCVHQESGTYSNFASKWAQTYVAQGRSLASVVFYATGTTEQIPISRQKVAVRVREGGPDGPIVGVEKIATGNGDWSGDATWGVYSVAFAPGEVPIQPGKTYAIEFESLENAFTLHGFINVKGISSGDTGGFTPMCKVKPDDYPAGRAYINGTTPTDYDIDMQVVEYADATNGWDSAVDAQNLIKNGDMRDGVVNISPSESRPHEWDRFKVVEDTVFRYISDPASASDKFARAMATCGKTCDGGYVQKVSGLNRADTYRVSGQVRSSWALDDVHISLIGFDPTGQTDKPDAATIVWKPMPPVNGVFVSYTSGPIRPASDSISVWLRAKCNWPYCSPMSIPGMDPFEFRTDFDNFALRRVNTGVPGQASVLGASVVPAGLDPVAYAAVSKRADDLIAKLPARQVLTGKGRPTKLGLYYLMDNKESQGMLDLADGGRVPIIKTIAESCDRAYRVKQHNPNAIWVVSADFNMRMDAGKQTPEQAADVSFKMVSDAFAKVPKDWQPMVDFIECTQIMWNPTDAKSALWYSEFLCDFLPRIANLGPRPIVLNSAVGNLPVDPTVLSGMVPGLRLAKHLGGAWGYQAYTIKYTKDIDVELSHSLRYRRAYDYFRASEPDLADFPIILVEGGVDEVGDPDKSGWKARGSLAKYTDWLSWFDSELMKDDQVLGVTLFKIGAPSIWKSFELEPVVPWLDKHYKSVNAKQVGK